MNKHLAPFQPLPFSDAKASLGTLTAGTAAALLGSVGDIAFVLDAAGIIQDVAITVPELVTIGLDRVVGKRWHDIVTVESTAKVDEMLADAGNGAPARWRQINHAAGDGEDDVPVRYLTVGLGKGGGAIAIGRDMRAMAVLQQRLLQAQQSLERDYLKMRQAEARYRMLFDMASEAVLIVDAGTRRIREANPAAHRMLGAKEAALVDQLASSVVAPAYREAFVAHLGAAEVADDVPPVTVHLAHADRDVTLSARLFRQAHQSMLLVKIAPVAQTPADPRHAHDAALSDVIERLPDAFVLTDSDLTILTANTAFVDLAELPAIDRVRGEKLGNWLGRPGIDLDLMLGQLREYGVVRNVASIMRGIAGAQEDVEVSAVLAPSGEGDCYGFTIRNVGRRLRPAPVAAGQRDMPRSVDQLTGLVGRMSMKEIVRESSDLIERICIEAALAYTSDNRASAAEILGLSRQSLYSKMHRHGLGNLTGQAD